MKTIEIAHLYYDVMNLNGDAGNMMALKRHFESQGVKLNIHFLTIDDKIDFNKFDLYYIGNGSRDSFNLVLDDIMKYKNDIKEAIENNKYFICTGTSMELFGGHFNYLNNKKQDCLGIFDYFSEEVSDQIVGEFVFQTSLINDLIIGFQNRYSKVINRDNHLLNMVKGTGKLPDRIEEGIIYKNFMATYLLGPLLIRNPKFTDYLVKKILKEKDIPYKEISNTYEENAYQEFMKNFVKE